MVKKILIYSIVSIFILFIYHLIANYIDNQLILPSLISLSRYLFNLEVDVFFSNIFMTLLRTLYGYGLSIIIGLLLAIVANYKYFNKSINRMVSILRTIPTISIIIIILIWFEESSMMYLIGFLVVFPILYEMFYHNIKYVDPNLKEVSIVYQFNKWEKIKYLYFYNIIESFFLSLKQTFGLAFKVMIMSEVFGQARIGIGSRLNNARVNVEMEGIFVWTIILILLVLLLEQLITILSKKVLKWK